MGSRVKIGRNDPCPCGSGKKYKECCLNKSGDERFGEALMYAYENIQREARMKGCLHPNKAECKGKIIKAHAIQENRILQKLCVNGQIVTNDKTDNFGFQNCELRGRGIATTFSGFCKYHDKVVFQDIEDKPYIGTPKQIFLFTYRTMAWHYLKKKEQQNAHEIIKSKIKNKGFDLSNTEDVRLYTEGLKRAVLWNEEEKSIFDAAILNEDYEAISSWTWEIPYEIAFAISMMTEIPYDIDGKRINDLLIDEQRKEIYLNILPIDGKSVCIWSWLKKNDDVYVPFTQQFEQLTLSERENYFNNFLPLWSDSLVISPVLWDKWGEDIQNAFTQLMGMSTLIELMERDEPDHSFQIADTPWNLFEQVDLKRKD